MKVFITGCIYNISEEKIEEITTDVQRNLGYVTNGSHVIFQLTMDSPKQITLTYQRTFSSDLWYNKGDMILDADTYMICGITKDFKPPYMWYEVPFGYTYYIEQSEFIKCYKKSAVMLGATKPKKIELTVDNTEVKMKLCY